VTRVRRVLVVAGEASGDRHAAGLAREALARDPSLRFLGVGGPALRDAGAEILVDMEALSIIGIAEAIAALPRVRRVMARLERVLREEPPDALLLVDLPDFNLALAKRAKRAGIPVAYFVSPQVWAWRRGRVRTIRERVDRMIVLFPFEAEFYREHGVPVTLAGHPLAEVRPAGIPREEAKRRLGLDPGAPALALLPGSRRSELDRLLDPMLATAAEVRRRLGNVSLPLPVAPNLDPADLRDRIAPSGLPVVPLPGAFDEIAAAADAALVASGTATLELAVREVPHVIVYRTSPLTYLLGRLLVHVRHVGLVNLVAPEPFVPELLQGDFTPDRAADALLPLLAEGPERRAMVEGLREVRRRLGEPGAYARAAGALLEVLDGVPPAGENPGAGETRSGP